MVLNIYLPNGKIEVFSSLEAEAAGGPLGGSLFNRYDALTTALYSELPYLGTTSGGIILSLKHLKNHQLAG